MSFGSDVYCILLFAIPFLIARFFEIRWLGGGIYRVIPSQFGVLGATPIVTRLRNLSNHCSRGTYPTIAAEEPTQPLQMGNLPNHCKWGIYPTVAAEEPTQPL